MDWRAKLDTQRGAVLATELKNNSCKIAKWTASSQLAGSDVIKFGCVIFYMYFWCYRYCKTVIVLMLLVGWQDWHLSCKNLLQLFPGVLFWGIWQALFNSRKEHLFKPSVCCVSCITVIVIMWTLSLMLACCTVVWLFLLHHTVAVWLVANSLACIDKDTLYQGLLLLRWCMHVM